MWQHGWNIILKVDRPNFGVLLDAFHIAGYEFVDPTLPNFTRPDGPARLEASLAELVRTIPASKIFFVQLADAEKLDKPFVHVGTRVADKSKISEYHVEGQQPHMSWSRNCRLFPYEEERGAFMPIEQVMEAFLATGFKGWAR